jgi:hypothetical protein
LVREDVPPILRLNFCQPCLARTRSPGYRFPLILSLRTDSKNDSKISIPQQSTVPALENRYLGSSAI